MMKEEEEEDLDEEKSEHFYRLICLVVNLGTEVLQKLFLKYIPNGQSVEAFLKSKGNVMNNLKKRIFNDNQLRILSAAPPDVSLFDISLLYILISNLSSIQAPNGGWYITCPMPSDQSAGALLMNLRGVINEAIAHWPKGTMKKSNFEKYWNEAKAILIELAGEVSQAEKDYVRGEIEKIKVEELVGDKRFKLAALQLWEEQDRNCEKMLSILEDVSRKFDDQSKVLEVMKTQLQTVTDQINALTVQNRQVPGTSSGTEEHFHQQRGDIEDTKTHTQKIAHQPKTPIIQNTPIFGSSSGAESSVPENTEINELHEHKESINPAQKDTEYDIIKNKLRTEIIDHYEVTGYSTTAVPVLVKGEDVHIDEMCLMPLMRVSNSVATAKQGHTSMQDSSDATQLTAVENEDVMTGRISTIHELFQKDGQSIRRLCISGEAGEGKTTVCQKIISTWCKVHGNNGNVSDTDYKFLKAFDLLFYIPLRKHKTADVIEMVKIGIVRETSHNALKEVLQKESEKCLIILDGLDEWLPPKDCKHKVPYIDPREQFTILITSRPWKLEVLRPKICEGTQNRVYLSESELYDIMIDDMNTDVCDDTYDDDIDINDYIYEDHDDYVEPEDDDAYDYMYD